MGYIKGFGFEIYRLREAKTENEILVYDIINNQYNTYSTKRAVELLIEEFKLKKINYDKFIIDELLKLENPDNDRTKKVLLNKAARYKIINSWIEEETILVHNLGFKPVKEKIYIDHRKTYFNTFNIPKSMDKDNYLLDKHMTYEEFKSLCPNIYKLLINLHNKCDLGLQDTLYKLADKLQYPFEKSQDCIIFYPAEAAGKGIFYKHIIQPIFEEYCSKVLMKKLNTEFNAFIKHALVLILEEGKRDLELIETLKEIVTEGSMLINPKGKDATEENVYFLTFVFSNNMNPIDLGKRRGSYHLCRSLGKTIEESSKIGAALCLKIPDEIPFFLQYLHNLEIEHQKALVPFNTIAKGQVTDLNKNTLELFYDYICTFPNIDEAIFDSNRKRFMTTGTIDLDLVESIDEIYISKDLIKDTYNNFCMIEGFRTNLIKHNKDIVQLWSLMNIPVDSHKRILITKGKNEGRKLDHLRLKDINKHITKRFEE